jgi:hypothetical protein
LYRIPARFARKSCGEAAARQETQHAAPYGFIGVQDRFVAQKDGIIFSVYARVRYRDEGAGDAAPPRRPLQNILGIQKQNLFFSCIRAKIVYNGN